MNPALQNILIAEIVGTHKVERINLPWNENYSDETNECYKLTDKTGKVGCFWPNVPGMRADFKFVYPKEYTKSLDAMWEAVESKWGDARFRVIFTAVLAGLFDHNEIDMCHVSAKEYAKAFLKTFDKWKES